MSESTQHDERTGPGRSGGGVRRTAATVRRQWPLVVGGLVVAVTASAGGAVAGSLITSEQIKNYTIQAEDLANGAVTSRVIKDGTVRAEDLTAGVRAALKAQPAAPGSTWQTGEGGPGDRSANDGDWYLDSTEKSLYTFADGTWTFVVTLEGPAGKDGQKGDAGSRWLTGAGTPDPELGEVGDWYLADSGKAYQKGADGWAVRVDLRGVAGPAGLDGDDGAKGEDGDDGLDGATWFDGSGTPEASVGAAGDLYLDLVTSDVYRRGADDWSLLTNIKGQKGDPGETGKTGPVGVGWTSGEGAPSGFGVTGSLYLDTKNGDVYRYNAGSWGQPVANLTGPTGAAGEAATGGGGATLLVDASVNVEQTPPSANGSIAAVPIFFGNETTDVGGVWSGATFTAPSAGTYQVQAQLISKDNATNPNNTVGVAMQAWFNNVVNGPKTKYGIYPVFSAANFPSGLKGRSSLALTVQMSAGETLTIGGLSANSAAVGTIAATGASNVQVFKVG